MSNQIDLETRITAALAMRDDAVAHLFSDDPERREWAMQRADRYGELADTLMRELNDQENRRPQ